MSDIIKIEAIAKKIFLIRGKRVILDRDLAELYGVETRTLKQQVRRNIARFPTDFMFVLTKKEFEDWRSHIVMSNSTKMGLRRPPMAFTEQGVAMLSSVLRSDKAIQVNRLFFKEYRMSNKEFRTAEVKEKTSKFDIEVYAYLLVRYSAVRC